MRACFVSITAFSFAVTQALGRAAYQLHSRDSTDICAQLNGLLEVPEPFAGTVPVGFLSEYIRQAVIP